MSNLQLELPGSDQAMLRAVVNAIDQQISSLPSHATVDAYRTAASALATSWAELGKLLALGEAAPLRECPRCKRLGMHAASRCGYCWVDLSPLPPQSGDQPGASQTAGAPANSPPLPHP